MKTVAVTGCVLLLGSLLLSPLEGQQEQVEPGQPPAREAMSGDETTADDAMVEEDAEPGETLEEAVLLMDFRWAELACEAWNENETLTAKLAAPGWAANNGDRGYKVIQIYRTDCESSPWVEVQIADQDGEARCVYGGPVQTEELIGGVDYIMHAQTERWQEMGAGKYGPMKGMMTGRLKFKGPKWEAMKNMGPFSSFLKLTGEVPSDASVCPPEALG